MQEIASLIQAIASLLWPVFAFTALIIFRAQIADLARRLKKGKLLGQEIELSESLDKLQKAAESVQKEVSALPSNALPMGSDESEAKEQDVVRRIVDEASRSPKAALISLASEVEKLAREVLATTGSLKGRRFVPMQTAIAELHETFGLSTTFSQTDTGQ